MKLQQLRYLVEIADGMNVSRAARVLHTSQPGLSRYVRLLEEELGVQIFVREKKRITRLTSPGLHLVAAAKRVLVEADGMERMARQFRAGAIGDLALATAHTHARYSLPKVIEQFTARYPGVRLRLRQGFLSQMVHWVIEGQADLFIATTPHEPHPELALIPCHQFHRVILTPRSHPLARKRRITLADVCAYPIITYDHEFSARTRIMRSFHQRQLTPNVVLSATDADVMKTYVRSGLGIAIVAHTTYDRQADADLRAIDARHLFETSSVVIGLRKGTYLTEPILDFIGLYAPQVRRAQIVSAVAGK